MEQQIAGKAVIVSDRGGLPEMVRDGETGLVFPAEQPSALADRLQSLLADGSRRERIGAAAREWGRATWNIDRMIDEVLACYGECSRRSPAERAAARGRNGQRRPPIPDPLVSGTFETCAGP